MRPGWRVTARAIDRRIEQLRTSPLGDAAFALGTAAGVAVFALHVGVALSGPSGQDFQAFLSNAEDWRHGTPYAADRDANAPHVLLVFLPFSRLPLTAALAIWMLISAVAACATWRLISQHAGVRLPTNLFTLLLVLFLIAPATTEMIVNANMVWVLWLPFTAAWLLVRNSRFVAGGAVLGALVTAKPFLALWVPYFVLRRNWNALGGVMLGMLAALTIGIAAAGLDAWIAWVGALSRVPWHSLPFNTSVAGVLARVSALQPAAWAAASIPFVGLAGYSLVRRPADTDREWSLLLLTALAVGPLGWRFYHCWLIGPMAGWLSLKPPGPVSAAMLVLLTFTPIFWSDGRPALFALTLGSSAFWTATAVWAIVALGDASRDFDDENVHGGWRMPCWRATHTGSSGDSGSPSSTL